MVVETVPKDILDLLNSAILAKAANMSYGEISIGITATSILAAGASTTGFIIYNNSAQTIFLGSDVVTIVNGMPVVAGASYSNDLWTGAVYGIVAAGTSDARVEVFY